MTTQLITIKPDGSVFGLVHKKGLPLHRLGRAQIERVSDIEWNESASMWFIRIKRGPWAGLVVDGALLDSYGVTMPCRKDSAGNAVFDDYDAAVQLEIALVQAAQRRGEHWI
jgi:hypothetical protein